MLANIDLGGTDRSSVDAPAMQAMQKARLNIGLPVHLVQQIDAYIGKHHITRSDFLAYDAQQDMPG